MKIVKSLEDFGSLLKGVNETIQNETKKQKGRFLSMLLGTLGVSLLGNMLAGREAIATNQGRRTNRAGYGSKVLWTKGEGWLELVIDLKKFLILPHSLTNFEVQKYYQNEPRFNWVYSRDNLPDKIKNRVYIINLDEYSDTGTHWTALYVLNNSVTYFDSFVDSVMCGYFCIGFIDFMLNGKNVTDFASFFSPNNF